MLFIEIPKKGLVLLAINLTKKTDPTKAKKQHELLFSFKKIRKESKTIKQPSMKSVLKPITQSNRTTQ